MTQYFNTSFATVSSEKEMEHHYEDKLKELIASLPPMSPEEQEEEKLREEKGIISVYVHKCFRCGHMWIPRSSNDMTPDDYNEKILSSDPPKSCARCKSKYWNKLPKWFLDA